MATIQKQLEDLQIRLKATESVDETIELAMAMKKLRNELETFEANKENGQKEALIEATKTELADLDLAQLMANSVLDIKIKRNKDTQVFDDITCAFTNKKLADYIYAAWQSLNKIQELKTVASISCKIDYNDATASEVSLNTKGKSNGNGGQSNGKKGYQDASGKVLTLKDAYKLVATADDDAAFAKFKDGKEGNSARWAFMTKTLAKDTTMGIKKLT